MRKRPYLWVVEMRRKSGEWEPTYEIDFGRKHARSLLKSTKINCPNDKFRLGKYVREEKP